MFIDNCFKRAKNSCKDINKINNDLVELVDGCLVMGDKKYALREPTVPNPYYRRYGCIYHRKLKCKAFIKVLDDKKLIDNLNGSKYFYFTTDMHSIDCVKKR